MASIVAADSAAASLADSQRQIAVEVTSAGIALLGVEAPARSSSEDVAAQRIAGGAVVVVVVAAEDNCSWPLADFATDSAVAEVGRSRRKARPWPVAGSGSLSALGHKTMRPDIGLDQWYIDLVPEHDHN